MKYEAGIQIRGETSKSEDIAQIMVAVAKPQKWRL